ncbi:MAG: hypothetical protein ACXAD7_16890 [Candidatus Kariarchaeaceae archaeon]|jgi:hypothetical protein
MIKTYDNVINNIVVGFSLFSMMLVLLIPLSVNASNGWSDNFEDNNLDGWMLKSYSATSTVWYDELSATNDLMALDGGTLVSPDINSKTDSAHAYHDSSVAYGDWSLDWTVPDDNQSYCAIEFILTNPEYNFDWDGVSGLYQSKLIGYSLVLGSYSTDSTTPTIYLVKLSDGSSPITLASHRLNSSFGGAHHIKITRESDGKFEIFFDNELIIEANDNVHQSSVKFAFTSWEGNSSIDNIIINSSSLESNEEESNEDESPLILSLMFPTLIFIAYYMKRSKIK